MNLKRTPPQIRYAPPLLGEHTDQILKLVLGYSQGDVEDLRSRGIV